MANTPLAKQDPLTLQGSLFGAPEPAEHSAQNGLRKRNPSDPDLNDQDLTDQVLSDDALARPRRKTSSSKPSAEMTQDDEINKTNPNVNNTDEPAWAHHSQL